MPTHGSIIRFIIVIIIVIIYYTKYSVPATAAKAI